MKKPVEPKADRSKEREEERILKYLPLVKYIVGRLAIHFPSSLDWEDLSSVGVIGLVKAVRNYDPSRGASLKTYAYHQIRGAILDEIRRRNFLSRTRREKLRKLKEAEERLEALLNRPPTFKELQEAIQASEEEIRDLILSENSVNFLSLHSPCGEDESEVLGRRIASKHPLDPSEMIMNREEVELLLKAVKKLPKIERLIIVLYYKEGLMLKEIGEILNLSESRISQIHGEALYGLRKELSRVGAGV